MAPVAAQTRTRTTVVVASALAHALLLAVLLRAAPSPAPPLVDEGFAISLVNGRALTPAAPPPRQPASAPPAAAPPAKVVPPAPSEVEPQYVEVAATAPVAAERDLPEDPMAIAVAAASAAAGSECHLNVWLQQALQADPYVEAALPLIPRQARSVANAVMLWDGGWVAARPQAAAPLGAIRLALVAGIRAAPEACQTQEVRGPELMILTAGAETTVLAIGSGAWRWGDLLDQAAAPGLPAAAQSASLSTS